MDSNIIEQKKIDLQNQIQAIDEQIVKLESSLSELSQKYAPQAMSDDDLEAQIASNRARRIKKDNNAQVQWNWLKNRENGDLDLEKYLMRFFEETFWNKKSSEQLLSPNLNQLAKSNSSPDEIESYMEQVWDFSKKLTLKVNRKKT